MTPPPAMSIISLGGGVQSTTMLLMACRGELAPRPDVAIFADTGWEPAAVYEHLAWLGSVSSIPIERVSLGNLRADAIADPPRRAATPPYYVHGNGTNGMLRRQCTKEYKVTPLRRRVRELLGAAGVKQAEMWIGISIDEAYRMRDSNVRYICNRYPLIEARMTRANCIAWCEGNGYPRPPRSACIGCPYHSDAEWRAIKSRPGEWRDVLEFDEAIRRLPRINGDVFLHRSCRPLADVDLSTAEDHGQQSMMFGQECEGMCGI